MQLIYKTEKFSTDEQVTKQAHSRQHCSPGLFSLGFGLGREAPRGSSWKVSVLEIMAFVCCSYASWPGFFSCKMVWIMSLYSISWPKML